MLLSARFLTDAVNVNSYEHVPAVTIGAGDAQDLYLQLVDASVDRAEQGYSPPGRRYMPVAGATMTVTFTNTDTGPTTSASDALSPRINPSQASQLVRAATQPFAQDPSIWKVSILSSDPLLGTVNMKVTLTEPSRTLVVAQRAGLVLRVC